MEHFEKCKSECAELRSIKDNIRRRRQYLCSHDHPLEFWTATFDEMSSHECADCRENFACRSVCWECGEKYCVLCRPPPCTKQHCPRGHKYALTNSPPTYICDLCGLRPYMFGQKCYDDVKCNFGMCSSCRDQLSEELPFETTKNEYQKCDKCHDPLTFLPDQLSTTCTHCHRTIRTERECKPCGGHYCLACKPIEITRKITCQKKHKISYEEESSLCTGCRLVEGNMVDAECGFSLCEECFNTAETRLSELERIAGYDCEECGFSLRFGHCLEECHKCQ